MVTVDILNLIGNTPLVSVNGINSNFPEVEIFAKLECFNPGGSIKDRIALAMIEDAERSGLLTKDKIILEATSGNTGIGLAFVGAKKGYRVKLTMSESVSLERRKILLALGAEIVLTPAELSTDGAIDHAQELIKKEPDKYWLSDQYSNEANWRVHYEHTAMEIWRQTDGEVDMIISALGTTGTCMGIARRFREIAPHVKVVAVEPSINHKIQGLKNMEESYVPKIFDRSLPHMIVNVKDEEAFDTARKLALKEGVFVGMSSGAAMAATLKLAPVLKKGKIVAIFPDGGERYLSTNLFCVARIMERKEAQIKQV